jgi:heme exporter protein D
MKEVVAVAVIVREGRHVIQMNLMMNRRMIIISRGDTVVLLEISEDDRKRKKIRKNEMLAAGFATVATINAAHSIKKSVDQRKKRQQQLEDGEISPEEARKRKIKSNVWDAASVGLAALGIQEVVSEWKETRELIGEHKHFREKAKERAQKRALRRARSHDSYDRDEYR